MDSITYRCMDGINKPRLIAIHALMYVSQNEEMMMKMGMIGEGK
jgi:hypothetical protein